jgi:ubiquitin-activating enzyme E1
LDPSLKDKGASTISRHEAEASLVADRSDEAPEKSLKSLIQESKVLAASVQRRLNQIEFEKDDDSNGHVNFVSAASNLRAMCYGIAPC